MSKAAIDKACASEEDIVESILVKNLWPIFSEMIFCLNVMLDYKWHVVEWIEHSVVLKHPVMVFTVNFASSIPVDFFWADFILVWCKTIFPEIIGISFASLAQDVNRISFNDIGVSLIVPLDIVVLL